MEPEIKAGANVEVVGREIKDPIRTKEEVAASIEAVGAELRKLILDIKKMPRDKTLEPHQDEMRCLAQAQTQLQTGLMWLRRALEVPKIF